MLSCLRSYTSTLPGGIAARFESKYAGLTGRPFQTVAIVPKCGRRRLPILAAKFTVNSQQAVQTIPTAPPPSVQPTGVGLFPAFAGGLVALAGAGALIVSALRKNTASQSGAEGTDRSDSAAGQTPNGVIGTGSNSSPSDAVLAAGQRSGSVSAGGNGTVDEQPPNTGEDNQASSPLERQRQRLELERARARQAASELQNELLSRERELLEAQREGFVQVAGARGDVKESHRKVELLEAMVGALRERLRREEGRNAALEDEVESGRAEMARFEEQRVQLQERTEALRAELADTQARLLVAQARAAELDARLIHLVAQNKELERRVGELEAQLQARTASVAGAASSAEERLRLMQAAADQDRFQIAKLQGKLAEREAQLAALREGEKELQQVLERSKAAAGQMGELLRQRDLEMQRLQAALKAAEERGREQEKTLNAKIAALQQEREPQLQRLQEAVKEVEARRLAEAGAMRRELEELRRAHEAEVQQLRAAGGVAGLAALEEASALKEQLAALQSERDKEVALLNSQLQESARHAEELRETAKAQAAAQEEEVQTLKKQLEDAQLRAEQSSARRVTEVSELRSALEQQLGAACQEALDARSQLAAVKEQLDGVLSEEFLQLMEDELRQSIIPGANALPTVKATSTGSPETLQELRSLDAREAALGRQLESLQTELAELQSSAVARLGPAMVARAQELEATAAQCRKALRAREAMGDQAGVQRITQQLATLNSELAALYRSVMVPEARTRERAVRLELQDREIELRGVVEQQVRLQDRLEQERRVMQERKDKAVAAASGPTHLQLRKAMQTRIKALLKERERQAQEQAAAREKQLQAQLRATQSGNEAQQRELKAVQEAVEKQARLMEESWKVQLEASSRALQEAAVDKQRLAAELSQSTDQVRQQLVELDSLRRELLAARATVASLRRAAEGSRDTAAQQSMGAAKEVQRLAAEVQQLQNALQERERQSATSAQAVALPLQQTAVRAARNSRLPAGVPAPLLPAAASPPRVPPASNVLIRRGAASSTAAAEAPVVTAVAASAAVAARPATSGVEGAIQSESGALPIVNGSGSAGFQPLTPLRPGWPAQYGEVKLSPSSLPPPSQPQPISAAAGTAAVPAPSAVAVQAPPAAAMPASSVRAEPAGSSPRVGGSLGRPDTVAVPPSSARNGNGTGAGHAQSNSNGRGDGSALEKGIASAASAAWHAAAPSTEKPTEGTKGRNGSAVGQGGQNGNGAGTDLNGTAALASATADAANEPSRQETARAEPAAAVGPRPGVPPERAEATPLKATSPAAQPMSQDQVVGAAADSAAAGRPDFRQRVGESSREEVSGAAAQRSPADSAGGARPVVGRPEARAPLQVINGSAMTTSTAAASASTQPASPPPPPPPQQQEQLTGAGAQSSRRSVPPGPFDSVNSFPLRGVDLPNPAPSGSEQVPVQSSRPESAAPAPTPAPSSPPATAATATYPAAPPARGTGTDGRADSTGPSSSDTTASAKSMAAATVTSIDSRPTGGPAPIGPPPPAPAPEPTTAGGRAAAATAQPALTPLTPQKTPTPANFPDFVRVSPTMSNNSGGNNTSSSTAGASKSAALTPAPASAASKSPAAAQRQAGQGPAASPASPPGATTMGRVGASPSTSASAAKQPSKTQPPQSPAAQAMAAAAGAAEAARRAAAAAAVAAAAASPPKTPGFKTSPISEWGRPTPAPDALEAGPPTASGSSSTGPGPSEGSSVASADASNSNGTTFFSEAELGAEIAAIAQSLVQRTLGGSSGAARKTPRSPPAPGGVTARPTPPPVTASSLTTTFRQNTPGAAAAPPAGAGAGSVRRLQLSVGAYGVPHVAKVEKGSEDAYFMVTPLSGVVTSGSPARAARKSPLGIVSAIGIADGVGGWAEANVDPGQYSREVMDAAARAAEDGGVGADPRALLAVAQDAVRTIGSCTACVAVLTDSRAAGPDKGPSPSSPSFPAPGAESVLSIANLGDSGCRVVRRGSLVLATSAQEHQFNMPYQMAHPDNLPDTDTAEDAQMYQLALEPGDVVILATDGLFDNMWDEELMSLVSSAAAVIPPGLAGPAAAAAAQPAAQQLAASLVGAAFRHAQDPAFRSPWAVEIANQPTASWINRMFPRGGKMDDITAVVAIVTAA